MAEHHEASERYLALLEERLKDVVPCGRAEAYKREFQKKLRSDAAAAVVRSSPVGREGNDRPSSATHGDGFDDRDALCSILSANASTLGDVTDDHAAPAEALDAARAREQLRAAAVPEWTPPPSMHARLVAAAEAVANIPRDAVDDERSLLASLATHFERTRDALRVCQRVAEAADASSPRARHVALAPPADRSAILADRSAVASAADAADARARRLRAGARRAEGTTARAGGTGPGASYVHDADVRLAAVCEGWRARATRRARQFDARLRWLALSPTGRGLHKTAVDLAAAAVTAAPALPSLLSTSSRLEAEVDRLCRHFALDAGLTSHSLAAHARGLFLSRHAAQEARARPTPCEGRDPAVIVALGALANAPSHGGGGPARSSITEPPAWGAPGHPREPIFLLDPVAELGEMPPAAAAAAVLRGGIARDAAVGDDEGVGSVPERGAGRAGWESGVGSGSSTSGAGVWSPEDEYFPSGLDEGGGVAAASGETNDGDASFASDAILAAARVDQLLNAEARALRWSEGARVGARIAAMAANRSAKLADRSDETAYAAAKAAADAAVRAADPDMTPEAASEAAAEAVKPFLPKEKDPNARTRLTGKVSTTKPGEEDDDDPDDDAFKEAMLLGDLPGGSQGDVGETSGDAIARSRVSQSLATVGLLRHVRTRSMRERIVHARNHAMSVRARLAADRRYHESPGTAPPPEVDAYEEDSEVGVRVRGPSGHLVLYPAAQTETRGLEQDLLILGTKCLHHRALTARSARAGPSTAPAASSAPGVGLGTPDDDDDDDGAVNVDRAALLEDLYEAEARWQGALRELTTSYLNAAESAADPADRDALRQTAADTTFRRPRLEAPVVSPAGAYAAAVAAVALEAELVSALFSQQCAAETASREMCETGAGTPAAALARCLAAGFPPPPLRQTTGPEPPPMLATVGWIAKIPARLAAAEQEARLRYRIRGFAAGAPLRQATVAAALAEWRVLNAEEELRGLLAPAPEDKTAPDWLQQGASELESPAVLDGIIRGLCDDAEAKARNAATPEDDANRKVSGARVEAAATALAGVRAHAAALEGLAETVLLEQTYMGQASAVGFKLWTVRFPPLVFTESGEGKVSGGMGGQKNIVEGVTGTPSDVPPPPPSTRPLSAARCYNREFSASVDNVARPGGAKALLQTAGARGAAKVAALQWALVGAYAIAITHNSEVLSLRDDALFRRAVALVSRATIDPTPNDSADGAVFSTAGRTEAALALVWTPPESKNARLYRAKQGESTLADAVADLREALASEAGPKLVSVAKAFERQREVALRGYETRSALAKSRRGSERTFPTGPALVSDLAVDFTAVFMDEFRDAAARCDLVRWARRLRAVVLGSIDIAGAGGDGKGGISLNPARLGPFSQEAVAAAALEVGLLPVDRAELEVTPAGMLKLGSSGRLAPWMNGGDAKKGYGKDSGPESAIAAASAVLDTDWSAAGAWDLPGAADALFTKAPFLAMEEAHRLAAAVVSAVELRCAALGLLPGGGGDGTLLRDLERVAADVDPEAAAAKLTGGGFGPQDAQPARTRKALTVSEVAARLEARATYERLRLATAVRVARREFEGNGDPAAFAAATAALATLESPQVSTSNLPRAVTRLSGLRPSRRATVAAASTALDAAAAGRLTVEAIYDVTHPRLARRHCAYAVSVVFVGEALEDALTSRIAAALRKVDVEARNLEHLAVTPEEGGRSLAGSARDVVSPPIRRRFTPPNLLARVAGMIEALVTPATPSHVMFTIPPESRPEDLHVLMSGPGQTGAGAEQQRKAEARVLGLKRALDEHILRVAADASRGAIETLARSAATASENRMEARTTTGLLALDALGPEEVAQATEAFLGGLFAASGVPGTATGLSSSTMQVEPRAVREWTREMIGALMGRCEAAIAAERESAARRETALGVALVRAHRAADAARRDLDRARADMDTAVAIGVADKGAGLVIAHGRLARALLRERTAAAAVEGRAVQEAREAVAREIQDREAEVFTLRTNARLNKIELRQQALRELMGVRAEARVKMLAMVENATKGGPGGAFRSDKLTRIADLEDEVNILKFEKNDLEATVAKLQTVFKLRTASRSSAAAREIRERSAGAVAAEHEAVVAREAAEGRLGIVSRQLAATQAAVGQYRAQLQRAEGDLEHVTKTKVRLQRERVIIARENATLREEVADLERRRVMGSREGVGVGAAMRASAFVAFTRPGTAARAPGSEEREGEGKEASRRIAELEREVEVLRAEAAVAATTAEARQSAPRPASAQPRSNGLPRHSIGGGMLGVEPGSRPSTAKARPVSALTSSRRSQPDTSEKRPGSAHRVSDAAVSAKTDEVQSEVWKTRYDKLSQRYESLEAEADHMRATLASIEGLFGVEAAAVLAAEGAAGEVRAHQTAADRGRGGGLLSRPTTARPSGLALAATGTTTARPESAPVRRSYVPRASRLTSGRKAPGSPAKVKYPYQEEQPHMLELRPQPVGQPRGSGGKVGHVAGTNARWT